MAEIHNSELIKGIRENAKIQTSIEDIPTQLGKTVVPVMEVNPKLLRTANIVEGKIKAVTGSETIYTTPSDRDFYLQTITATIQKDATCDHATGNLQITVVNPDGVTKPVIYFPIITTTLQAITITLNFPKPILLGRSKPIYFTATYTAGVMVRSCNITGFTVED